MNLTLEKVISMDKEIKDLNRDRSFRIGPIRPPSEANSLLLQVTQGCTWNKCKFCQLYRHTGFKAYSADSIKADIDNMAYIADRIENYRLAGGGWDIAGINRELSQTSGGERESFYMVANWLINGDGSVFLQDGNTTALSSGRLSDVLIYLKQAFPQITRITSYGRAQNLAKVSPEEFAELKVAGLDRIHSGFESGSDEVLKLINKGVTAAEEITAGKNVKAGGIEFSVYFMPGVGGKALTEENARGMSEVINEINPDFIRIRTAAIKPQTGLYEDYLRGDFILCSEDDKVREIRSIIERAEGIETRLVSDHITNLLQTVEGSLKTDKDYMLGIIDRYLAMPEEDKRLYQAARRTIGILSPESMDYLSANDMNRLKGMADAVSDPYEWEIAMNEIISNYI
ncbi:MAG: radical SAM protein [Anaerovoracaceae bacterium]|nr:radical SAM protein [Anaerovoracaceae bacterium]